jgi:signal transduction histidine kinase
LTVRERRRSIAARLHLPSVSTVAFSALLLLMLALTVLTTLAFNRLNQQKARAADAAMREYASLGARLFGDHGYRIFEGMRLRTLASVYGAQPGAGQRPPTLPEFVAFARREMDRSGFAVGDTNRGYFRIDARTGRYDGYGAGASRAVGDRIAQLIATRPAASDARLEPMAWFMLDDAEPLTIGFATLHDAGGHALAHYGFMYSRRAGWKTVGDAVLRELPLLPASFVETGYRFGLDRSRTDTLVAITLYDAKDRVIYESRPPFAGDVRGEFRFNTGTGAFRAVESLHPSLVAAIRRSMQANRTTPFLSLEVNGKIVTYGIHVEALLPLVALLLAILAGFGLWREQRLTRARRDFVASVSHELRTPLAQIRMFTETLQLKRERDEEERVHWLNIIGREARRLGDLVENILLFSHIDAERTKIERERVDLGELIEEIIEGYVPLAAQREMHIVVDAPSRIFALVDPRAMRQVVVNLVDNALKYGPAGQVVRVDVEQRHSSARLTISDQGPGVKPADRRRMWKPFVRLGDRGTSGGSGIGLAVVRNLIALHSGTIVMDDAPGGGARFTIELKISESADGLPMRATGEYRARPASAPSALRGATSIATPAREME